MFLHDQRIQANAKNGNLITHAKSVIRLDVNFVGVVKVVTGVCVFFSKITAPLSFCSYFL